MPIPAPYLLGLQMYELDDEALALRAEVWRYLGPMMDMICDRHFAKILKFTPALEESLNKTAREWRRLVIHYTSRLFLNPFDEKFAEDAVERVEIEIGLAADMRTRGTIAQSILTNFSRELHGRFWLSRCKALQLTDVAQRVLTLDAANAMALHYTARARTAKKRGNELSGAIKDFDEAVKSVRSYVSDAVQSLNDNAAKLSRLAGRASEESSVATEAALNTASNASTIAAAVEQLSSSLGNISGQAVDGAQVGERAVARAVHTNEAIKSLSDAAEKVGSVVGLISQIAAQTNLLSLNATIEAARAGEAGRGFAVVASEVKSLAMQTSKGTQEVSEQIGKIQEATRYSIEEITGTGLAITKLAEIVESVSNNIDDQTHTTSSIAAEAARAAKNAVTVTKALEAFAETIGETRRAADISLEIAKSLSSGTAEVLEAINRLFEFAARHDTIEALPDLKQIPSAQGRPRVAS
jgi:methyl-accepting chemotaxis protein